jgi:hypothetical protein
MTNEAILQRLQELTQGLSYRSESFYPLEVVQYNIVKDDLSDAEIVELAGQPDDAQVEKVTLTHFLRNMTRVVDETDDVAKHSVEQYQTLQAFMLQHLVNVMVYRIGRVEITALTLGALTAGGYAGFKTTVVET